MHKRILFLLLIFIFACGYDSEENVLNRRLNNFLKSLPDDIRTAFVNKDYDTAKKLLSKRQNRIKDYAAKITVESNRVKFLKAEYKGNGEYIKDIPEEDLEFHKKLYKIIDYECIHTFTPEQIIDYFSKEFVERLEELQKK